MSRLLPRDDSRAQNRYGFVIVLILVAYGLSVSSLGPRWNSVILFVQILTVWVVFTVSESGRAQRIAGIALVVLGIVAVAGFFLTGGDTPPSWVSNLITGFSILLYLVAPIVVGRHLLSRRVIDLQTLLGAIAAYLLVGMMFGFIYRLLGSLQSTPFFGDQGPGTLSEDLFFSFTTLTTTGFGNLVPAANPGQTFAILEAIMGQLILVTAVAKIVTDWKPAPRPDGVGATEGLGATKEE